jgi:hypothetical protein
MSIASGYFETQARRSARWALVRNGLFVAVFVGFLTMVLIEGPAAGSGASLSTAVGLNSLFITLFGWRLVVAARRLVDVARHPIFRTSRRSAIPSRSPVRSKRRWPRG